MKPSFPPPPRFADVVAAVVCILAALTLTYPALAGGFLVNPVSDQYIAGYPFREFGAASLRETGSFPLWNPYLFGGMPYVAAMHGDIFYPTFLLRFILPTDVAMTWGMILHLFVAGFATYRFLRAVGLSYYPALFGGVAYMLSGQVVSLVSPGHDGKLFVSALLPIALLLVTRLVRDGKGWACGALALVVGLGVLSPHPQLLQYLLLATGAWGLMLAFGGAGEGTIPPKRAIIRLACALGAVVLGMAMGAVQYLPVREYVEWSPRAGGRDYAYATSFSMPIEEVFNTYLPQFTGILERYWGRNQIHFHSEYIGGGVLLLAAAAFGLGAMADQGRRRVRWFWAGAAIVSLLWALGGNTPFYHIVYAIVPGTKFFRAPSTIFFVTTFAVAVLAAMGAERMLAGGLSRRWVFASLGIGGGIALLASVGGLTQVAQNIADPRLAEVVDANAGDLVAGAWRSFLFLAALAGLIWAIGTERIGARLAATLLIAITVADLWTVERQYVRFSEPAATLYATDAAIEHVLKETQPVRVITLDVGREVVYHDPNLFGDGLMVHRVRIATGYHGNELGRYQILGDKAGTWSQVGNPTFWGLANVKYLYASVDSLPVPGIRRVLGPVRTAAGSPVWLFELPGEHPFAWVAPVIAKYPDDAIAQAVRAPNFPYRSIALIDPASSTPAVQLSALPQPLSIAARATHYAPGRFGITLDQPAPAGSALVVSENFYPGWTATVDGRPAVTERANLSLMAVALPAGAKAIEFTFDSAPYHTGKMITWIAILAAVALMVGAAVQQRVGERRGQHA